MKPPKLNSYTSKNFYSVIINSVEFYYSYEECIGVVDYVEQKAWINTEYYSRTTSKHRNEMLLMIESNYTKEFMNGAAFKNCNWNIA